jgi:hypothetical protein
MHGGQGDINENRLITAEYFLCRIMKHDLPAGAYQANLTPAFQQ